MVERGTTLPITFAILFAAVAGCATPKAALVYQHDWTYGPGYGRLDNEGDPIFIDHFAATVDGLWRMDVEADVTVGTFEIHLRNPGGSVSGLATTSGTSEFEGATGEWTVEILTDAPGNETPTGQIHLVVKTQN